MIDGLINTPCRLHTMIIKSLFGSVESRESSGLQVSTNRALALYLEDRQYGGDLGTLEVAPKSDQAENLGVPLGYSYLSRGLLRRTKYQDLRHHGPSIR